MNPTTNFSQRVMLFLLPILLFSAGCGGDSTTTDGSTDSTTTPKPQVNKGNRGEDAMGQSIPSPVQMAFYLLNSKSPYNNELLNPATKAGDYSNGFSQAINLGVYQADLGYAIAHHQTQDAIDYFESVKALGDKLGIFGSFEDNMIDRAEKNLDNRDSLMAIVTDAFKDAEVYLNTNAQPDVADLIVIGGWLESTYLATQTAQSSGSIALRKRIGEDKLILHKLVSMLKSHKTKAQTTDLIGELEALDAVYQQIKIEKTYGPAETDKEKKVTRIGSKSKVRYTKSQLDDITGKVAALRNRLTQ